MTSLRPRDRIALGVVAAVLVVVAFYFLVFNPQVSKVSDLNQQITAQKATLAQDETTYREGRAAEISLHMDRSEWAAVRRAVPVTADVPGLLRLLQNNSNYAGVSLQSVTMSGNAGAGSALSAATSTDASAASTVPESLQFGGSYPEIEQLARQLDHLVVIDRANAIHAVGPLVTIGSVSITTGNNGPAATLTATIYERHSAAATGTSTTVETTTP
jgi:Tfp pilus assembly protein PilO